jgi:hypothetical protein
MTPEQKLSTLLRSPAAPARDYDFEVRVARAIALRRAWMTVAAMAPWTIAAAAALWALQPVIGPASADLASAAPALGALLATAAVTMSGLAVVRRLKPA